MSSGNSDAPFTLNPACRAAVAQLTSLGHIEHRGNLPCPSRMKELRRRTRPYVIVLASILFVAVGVLLSVPNLRRIPALGPTNIVLHVSQITSRPSEHPWGSFISGAADPFPAPSLPPLVESGLVPFEGVEPAERINQEMMRRYQQKWEHVRKLQLPIVPLLYPSPSEETIEPRK